MTSSVITRFAPSPTGYLHIGGARTALFNWLYARHTGGKMLLRIEDTDRERSTDAAVAAILDGLSWLGLAWDGEVVHQFARAARHREIAEELLAAGKAYRAYETAEELNEMRAIARAEGHFARYDGRWRDRDPSEAPAGVAPTIRIKSPVGGETAVEDRVQGRVAFPNDDLDDFVILRSDGTPTYMLAVVVDDHDMGVTHIIRGMDHLTNAGRQKILYEAIGWEVPVMAHVPLIHGPDGAKLSKRHGAMGVDAYRAMGYLPEAMRNYLARLAWSHGDDEIMSTEEMIAWFDIDGIGKSAARFDFAKLENLNAHYIRAMPDDRLMALLLETLPHLPEGREFLSRLTPERTGAASRCPALPQGAGEDPQRHRRRGTIPVCGPAARAGTGGKGAHRSGRAAHACRFAGGTRHGPRLAGGAARGGGEDLCRRQGPEARQGRAATPRGADRPRHVARHLRRADAARARGKPGAHRRPGETISGDGRLLFIVGGIMARTPIHPGSHLAEELKELGISAAELARQIDVPVNRVTSIMNGQRGVSADTALRLGHWFGTTSEFWLNLHTLYELRVARVELG